MKRGNERAGLPAPNPAMLPVFEHKGKLVADSRNIAPFVEKDHAHLLRDIRRYVKAMERFNESKVGLVGSESKHLNDNKFVAVDYFIKAAYIDEKGKPRPNFYCTEMGCEMVASKMTGNRGIIFTAQYVKAFHAMRDELARRRARRAIGKPIRRSLTDALRDSGEVERMHGPAMKYQHGTWTYQGRSWPETSWGPSGATLSAPPAGAGCASCSPCPTASSTTRPGTTSTTKSWAWGST